MRCLPGSLVANGRWWYNNDWFTGRSVVHAKSDPVVQVNASKFLSCYVVSTASWRVGLVRFFLGQLGLLIPILEVREAYFHGVWCQYDVQILRQIGVSRPRPCPNPVQNTPCIMNSDECPRLLNQGRSQQILKWLLLLDQTVKAGNKLIKNWKLMVSDLPVKCHKYF